LIAQLTGSGRRDYGFTAGQHTGVRIVRTLPFHQTDESMTMRAVFMGLLLNALACGEDSAPGSDAAGSRGLAGRSAGDGGSGADTSQAGAAANGGSGKTGTGASGDGGDAGSISMHPPLPMCSESTGSCPSFSIGVWKPLLNASDLGAGARLLAMGGNSVLAAFDDGTYKVVRLSDPAEQPSPSAGYTPWDFPHASAQAKPVSILEGLDFITVLTCDEARTHCSVWRAEVGNGELGAWNETPLPSDLEARGLVLDNAVDAPRVCVYGNGMYCDPNSWIAEIPVTAGLTINAVAFGGWSLAVGEHGRWFKRTRDTAGSGGPWEEQPSLADVSLTQTSVAANGGSIVGDGKLLAALGNQAMYYDCSLETDVAAVLLDPGFAGLSYLVSQSGQVFQHAPVTAQRTEAYCAYQDLMLDPGVVAAGATPCSAANNPRVLTESGVFGQSICLLTN
jgi:hypothetical protein